MGIIKYEQGGDWPPAEGHEASAGINVATPDMAEGDWWWDRIECHGHTLIEAQQLRDRVLRGLYLEAQERLAANALAPSQWPSAEPGHD